MTGSVVYTRQNQIYYARSVSRSGACRGLLDGTRRPLNATARDVDLGNRGRVLEGVTEGSNEAWTCPHTRTQYQAKRRQNMGIPSLFFRRAMSIRGLGIFLSVSLHILQREDA